MNSGIPVPSLLKRVLANALWKAVATEGADMGNVQLFERRTGELRIAAQCGFGLDFLDHFAVVRREDGSVCGRAMIDGGTVAVADVTTDPLFVPHRAIARSARFRAVQSTPLLARNGRFVGMLSMHFRRPRSLSRAALQRTEHEARRVAALIEWVNP